MGMIVISILMALVVIFLLVVFLQGGEPELGGNFTDNRALIEQLSPGEKERIMVLLREGKKIEAIKLCRTLTGCGLKEAKDTVEKLLKTF